MKTRSPRSSRPDGGRQPLPEPGSGSGSRPAAAIASPPQGHNRLHRLVRQLQSLPVFGLRVGLILAGALPLAQPQAAGQNSTPASALTGLDRPTPLLLPTLTNAAQVLGLGMEGARLNPHPVHISGVVTYVAVTHPNWIFVQDDTAGILVTYEEISSRPAAGQAVVVEGVAGVGAFHTYVRDARVRVTGTAPLPAPRRTPIEKLFRGADFGHWVRLQGVVRDAGVDGDRLVFQVQTDGHPYYVWVRRPAGWGPPADWMDAELEMDGVAWTATDAAQRPFSIRLHVPDLAQIRVLKPGSTNTFARPMSAARDLRKVTRREDHRVRLQAVVNYAEADNLVAYLQDDTGPFGAYLLRTIRKDQPYLHGLRQAQNADTVKRGPLTPLRPGDVVEIVGSPSPEAPFVPMLHGCEYRILARTNRPQAGVVTMTEAFRPANEGRVVTLRARLVDQERDATHTRVTHRLWLEADGRIFEARLNVAVGDEIQVPDGSLLDVTGVCTAITGEQRQPQGIRLLLRDATDLKVRHEPEPWLGASARRILLGAAGAIALVLAWAWTLRRQVGQRTAELQTANQALEARVREHQRRAMVQRATYEISEAVHTADTLPSLYQRIHAIIRSLMPAENFFLLLQEPGTDRHFYAYHVDQMDPWPAPRKVSGGLVGHILASGRPLLVDRASMTNPANPWHFVSGTPSAVWLGVPLTLRGATIGVMALQDYQNPRAYGEEEKQILTYVAAQTALAIERRRAEEDLLRALAREKELGELKSSFVSLVSHEFRTPLGVILSASEILDRYFDRLPAEKRRKHLEMIFRATRNLAELVEGVLLLGKVEQGRLTCAPAALDLAGLSHELAAEIGAATHQRCPIEVRVPVPLPEARADSGLLRHILTNLLGNAVKYSEPGQPVELTILREGPRAILTIRDRGIGIPDEDRAQLFRSFARGRNVGAIPGTGLGLLIVQRCLDLHGGHIDLQSAPGRGTTVTVSIPVFPAPANPISPT